MKIVMISGKQGSGKTTLQTRLRCHYEALGQKVAVVNFADILYEMHEAVLGILNKYWPKRDIVKDGPLLQVLGTEWGRKTIDENVWVKCLQIKLKSLEATGHHLALIGDCRFENEFDGFPEALRVRLECPEDVRWWRCSMWRENTGHASEVGLDRYAEENRFDVYIPTDRVTEEESLAIVYRRLELNNWVEQRQPLSAKQDAAKDIAIALDIFNDALRGVERRTGHGANFAWRYNQAGEKYLECVDIGPLVRPDQALIDKACVEVPTIIEQAEALVVAEKDSDE